MTLPNLTGETIKTLGGQIVAELRESLRGEWNSLSAAELDLIRAVADDVAQLQLEAIAFAGSPEAVAHYQREMRQVTAQLANIAAARQIRAADAVLRAAGQVIGRAAQVTLGALTTAI